MFAFLDISGFLSIVRGIKERKQEHALAAPGACGVTRASRGLFQSGAFMCQDFTLHNILTSLGCL